MVIQNWINKNSVYQNGRLVDFSHPPSAEDYVLDCLLNPRVYETPGHKLDSSDIAAVTQVVKHICEETSEHTRIMFAALEEIRKDSDRLEFLRWLGDDIVIERIGTF